MDSHRTRTASGRALSGRLRAVHPPGLHWEVAFGARSITIGSLAHEATPALEHEDVFPRHLAIRYESDHVRHVIRALHGATPTSVDGRAMGGAGTPLRDGTVVRLGAVCLVYETSAGDRAALVDTRVDIDAVPGRAPVMDAFRMGLVRAGEDEAPVLLEGESGTGKRRVVQELHRIGRHAGPLVILDAASLPCGRLETMLRRRNGTMFVLDEVGELAVGQQLELLELLRQPGPGMRLVAMTRFPQVRLRARIRADLLTMLSTCQLQLPPLRQRRGDILDWLRRIAVGPHAELSVTAAEAILLAAWPDNLHGLTRLVDQLAHVRGVVHPSDLPTWVGHRRGGRTPPVPSPDEFVTTFDRLEGNVSALARHFARNRRQIYRWIEKHGLGKPRDESS